MPQSPQGTWPWPPPPESDRARHLRRGQRLPDLKLPSSSGGSVSLAALAGWWAIFVYPWTGRPGLANPPDWDTIPGAHGSTPQLEGLAHLHSAFTGMAGGALAVSSQDGDHHRELIARLRLPFEILSDAEGRLRDRLSLPTFQTGGVTYLERLTIVARDGVISRVFHPVHPPDTHAREVLAYITGTAPYHVESRLRRPPDGT